MDQPDDLLPAFHAKSYSQLPTPQRSAQALFTVACFVLSDAHLFQPFLHYSPNNIARYVGDHPHTPRSPLPNAYVASIFLCYAIQTVS
ncbi:hypothetical protein P691DRAFT_813509 [Macrolepiota fuliginosa MF-IS2]|uniref:Uncharacterized protein n=1 Tax=Macrolepiota fuliginosa MF-IS2 TaxID=1400762 RepID=A0A9P5XCH8_9AGAR|nr:hypothetical protein P691DRAFT_813509 [Macrolepiota fuliginosa MF-IS2]